MCPCWMPLVVKALNAAKFCAKPAAAIICINTLADGFCNNSKENLAIGCKAVKPPTVPKAKGISIQNLKTPLWILQWDKLVYVPLLEAYAWAPASMALKSLPVANTTASIPFIIPLLWVTALKGSISAIFTAW